MVFPLRISLLIVVLLVTEIFLSGVISVSQHSAGSTQSSANSDVSRSQIVPKWSHFFLMRNIKPEDEKNAKGFYFHVQDGQSQVNRFNSNGRIMTSPGLQNVSRNISAVDSNKESYLQSDQNHPDQEENDTGRERKAEQDIRTLGREIQRQEAANPNSFTYSDHYSSVSAKSISDPVTTKFRADEIYPIKKNTRTNSATVQLSPPPRMNNWNGNKPRKNLEQNVAAVESGVSSNVRNAKIAQKYTHTTRPSNYTGVRRAFIARVPRINKSESNAVIEGTALEKENLPPKYYTETKGPQTSHGTRLVGRRVIKTGDKVDGTRGPLEIIPRNRRSHHSAVRDGNRVIYRRVPLFKQSEENLNRSSNGTKSIELHSLDSNVFNKTGKRMRLFRPAMRLSTIPRSSDGNQHSHLSASFGKNHSQKEIVKATPSISSQELPTDTLAKDESVSNERYFSESAETNGKRSRSSPGGNQNSPAPRKIIFGVRLRPLNHHKLVNSKRGVNERPVSISPLNVKMIGGNEAKRKADERNLKDNLSFEQEETIETPQRTTQPYQLFPSHTRDNQSISEDPESDQDYSSFDETFEDEEEPMDTFNEPQKETLIKKNSTSSYTPSFDDEDAVGYASHRRYTRYPASVSNGHFTQRGYFKLHHGNNRGINYQNTPYSTAHSESLDSNRPRDRNDYIAQKHEEEMGTTDVTSFQRGHRDQYGNQFTSRTGDEIERELGLGEKTQVTATGMIPNTRPPFPGSTPHSYQSDTVGQRHMINGFGSSSPHSHELRSHTHPYNDHNSQPPHSLVNSAPKPNVPHGFVHTQLQLPPINVRFHLLPVRDNYNESSAPMNYHNGYTNPYSPNHYQPPISFTTPQQQYQPHSFHGPVPYQPYQGPLTVPAYQPPLPYSRSGYDPERTLGNEHHGSSMEQNQGHGSQTNLGNGFSIPSGAMHPYTDAAQNYRPFSGSHPYNRREYFDPRQTVYARPRETSGRAEPFSDAPKQSFIHSSHHTVLKEVREQSKMNDKVPVSNSAESVEKEHPSSPTTSLKPDTSPIIEKKPSTLEETTIVLPTIPATESPGTESRMDNQPSVKGISFNASKASSDSILPIPKLQSDKDSFIGEIKYPNSDYDENKFVVEKAIEFTTTPTSKLSIKDTSNDENKLSLSSVSANNDMSTSSPASELIRASTAGPEVTTLFLSTRIRSEIVTDSPFSEKSTLSSPSTDEDMVKLEITSEQQPTLSGSEEKQAMETEAPSKSLTTVSDANVVTLQSSENFTSTPDISDDVTDYSEDISSTPKDAFSSAVSTMKTISDAILVFITPTQQHENDSIDSISTREGDISSTTISPHGDLMDNLVKVLTRTEIPVGISSVGSEENRNEVNVSHSEVTESYAQSVTEVEPSVLENITQSEQYHDFHRSKVISIENQEINLPTLSGVERTDGEFIDISSNDNNVTEVFFETSSAATDATPNEISALFPETKSDTFSTAFSRDVNDRRDADLDLTSTSSPKEHKNFIGNMGQEISSGSKHVAFTDIPENSISPNLNGQTLDIETMSTDHPSVSSMPPEATTNGNELTTVFSSTSLLISDAPENLENLTTLTANSSRSSDSGETSGPNTIDVSTISPLLTTDSSALTASDVDQELKVSTSTMESVLRSGEEIQSVNAKQTTTTITPTDITERRESTSAMDQGTSTKTFADNPTETSNHGPSTTPSGVDDDGTIRLSYTNPPFLPTEGIIDAIVFSEATGEGHLARNIAPHSDSINHFLPGGMSVFTFTEVPFNSRNKAFDSVKEIDSIKDPKTKTITKSFDEDKNDKVPALDELDQTDTNIQNRPTTIIENVTSMPSKMVATLTSIFKNSERPSTEIYTQTSKTLTVESTTPVSNLQHDTADASESFTTKPDLSTDLSNAFTTDIPTNTETASTSDHEPLSAIILTYAPNTAERSDLTSSQNFQNTNTIIPNHSPHPGDEMPKKTTNSNSLKKSSLQYPKLEEGNRYGESSPIPDSFGKVQSIVEGRTTTNIVSRLTTSSLALSHDDISPTVLTSDSNTGENAAGAVSVTASDDRRTESVSTTDETPMHFDERFLSSEEEKSSLPTEKINVMSNEDISVTSADNKFGSSSSETNVMADNDQVHSTETSVGHRGLNTSTGGTPKPTAELSHQDSVLKATIISTPNCESHKIEATVSKDSRNGETM